MRAIERAIRITILSMRSMMGITNIRYPLTIVNNPASAMMVIIIIIIIW